MLEEEQIGCPFGRLGLHGGILPVSYCFRNLQKPTVQGIQNWVGTVFYRPHSSFLSGKIIANNFILVNYKSSVYISNS